MPFAATWMDLKIVIINEVSKIEIDKHHTGITYMCNLKKDTNELIYKAEINSQTQKANLSLPKENEQGKDKLEVWD